MKISLPPDPTEKINPTVAIVRQPIDTCTGMYMICKLSLQKTQNDTARPRNLNKMKYNTSRKKASRRLQGYDYSRSGAYFVTICVKGKEPFLGSIDDGHVNLSQIGQVVEKQWRDSEQIRSEISLDYYVIMPDHFHGIVLIDDGMGFPDNRQSLLIDPSYKNQFGPQRQSLSTLISQFKGAVTRRAHRMGRTDFRWQPNFHDRIIRNQQELMAIRTYISNNPHTWVQP